MAIESFQPRPPGDGRGTVHRFPRRADRRSHTIFTALQREIVLGILPPRSVLLELDLADRFECSQSTVREALLQLQEEGLVIRMPHRATHVVDCLEADARELLRIRHEMECRGVVRALKRFDSLLQDSLLEDIEAMRAAAIEGDEYLLSVHDRQFHLRLFGAADLPSVQPILVRCLIHNHRYKILNSRPNRELMETAERHFTITAALDTGNVERVQAALSHHISTIVDFGPSIIRNDPLPMAETP